MTIVEVAPGEVTSGDQPVAHGLEETGRDELEAPDGRDSALRVGVILGKNRIVVVRPVHGDRIGCGHRGDAWNGADLLHNRGVHAQGFFGIGHLRIRNRNPQRQDCFRRGEAGLHLFERPEGPDHQSGADQQHQRHGHLRDHENAPGSVPFPSVARVAAAFAQARSQLPARVLEGRYDAEENSGYQGNCQGEEQN